MKLKNVKSWGYNHKGLEDTWTQPSCSFQHSHLQKAQSPSKGGVPHPALRESLCEWALERWEPDSSRIRTVIYVCLNSSQISCFLKMQGWGRESFIRCSAQGDSEMISQPWNRWHRRVGCRRRLNPPSLWSRGGVPYYHFQEMKDDKSSCCFLFLSFWDLFIYLFIYG